MEPVSAGLTRRQVLASTAGVGAAAMLRGGRAQADTASLASSATSVALRIDFAETAYFPLLKSKIGVGRALDSTQIWINDLLKATG